MMKKSVWVVLVIVTLLLAACGPAMQPATGPQTDTGEVFMVALPRLQVDFDAQGNPGIVGVNLADVAKYTGMNFAGFQLNKFYIDWMTAANVQHIELRQTGNGIVLFVNGKPLPNIAWSDQSLQAAGDFAGLFNVQNTQMIRKFLPIVRRLGLDLVLTFPKAEGVAAIPLADPNQVVTTTAAPSNTPASAIVQFEVKYDENGVPGILGISAADLAAMGVNAPLALAPSYVKLLEDNNIQTLELRGKSDGLFLYVNGNPLPNIAWDDTFLNNTADLYAQMNPSSPYIGVVKTIVPMINKADIGVMVHFPLAAGQTPIAAKMH
jgi:sulfur carrier protein ThiS